MKTKKKKVQCAVSSMTLDERLTVVLLTKKRFAGRMALEARAKNGSRAALAKIEESLGLCPEGWVSVETERGLRDDLTERLVEIAGTVWRLPLTDAEFASERALAARLARASDGERLAVWYRDFEQAQYRRQTSLGRALENAFGVRRTTARSLRMTGQQRDPLASRAPDNVVFRLAEQRAREAYRVADLRRASHGHVLRISMVPVGGEGASSETDTLSSREAGMSKAYQRQGFRVTSSKHVLFVSVAILKAPPSVPGALYLRPDLRVVSGRGTSLKVERRTARGAWK